MKVFTTLLYDNKPNVSYTSYLHEGSEEIDKDRQFPAMIICGGGAYLGISDREKEPVALHYLQAGFQVFVLDYQTEATGNAQYPNPLLDLAMLMKQIRLQGETWQIDNDKIAIIGFSAGANLCAQLATHWHNRWLAEGVGTGDNQLLKPNAVILAYPLLDFIVQEKYANLDPRIDLSLSYTDTTKRDFMHHANKVFLGKEYTENRMKEASPYYFLSGKTPPTFLWTTAQDDLVYPQQCLHYANKMIELGVPVELHLFEEGQHGLSLGTYQASGDPTLQNADVAQWQNLALRFLHRRFGEF